jgi:hypothetical protein
VRSFRESETDDRVSRPTAPERPVRRRVVVSVRLALRHGFLQKRVGRGRELAAALLFLDGVIADVGYRVPLLVRHRAQLALRVRELLGDLGVILAVLLELRLQPSLALVAPARVHVVIHRSPDRIRLAVVVVVLTLARREDARVAALELVELRGLLVGLVVHGRGARPGRAPATPEPARHRRARPRSGVPERRLRAHGGRGRARADVGAGGEPRGAAPQAGDVSRGGLHALERGGLARHRSRRRREK